MTWVTLCTAIWIVLVAVILAFLAGAKALRGDDE